MPKEQLTHIRQLIKQKRYDEARKQLQSLVDRGDPTAEKWLAKLNEIAPSKQFDYDADRLTKIRKQKETHQVKQAQVKRQRRSIGCLLRGCAFTLIMGVIVFLLLPFLFAASITSTNPQVQSAAGEVFTFVEEQQENPVGRAVTTMYTQTSGRAMQTVVEPRQDDICDIAIERAAQNGRTVSRAECNQTFDEAMICVTDRFDEAESCLRDYMYTRCIQQAGNTQQGRTYCTNFVRRHMGPE